MMILPDHPTPLALRTHTRDAVPYMIYDSTQEINNNTDSFTEENAAKSGIYIEKGYELIKRLIK